jgi:hypothetical protein
VTEHDGQEFAGVPVAGNVALRFGEGAKEPAEVVLVGPHRDVDLIAAEEGDGSSDAVDSRAVREVALEVESESLLCSAANGDDDVLRTKTVEEVDQSWIIDGCVAVHGCHVDVVFGNGDSLPCKPIQIAFRADRTGHDPEGVAGLTDVGFKEEFAQILETGKTFDRDGLYSVPYENHKGGVGDGEIRVEEGFAVVTTLVEVFEGWCGGDDEEAAVCSHDFDGFLSGAIEEVNAKDAVGSGEGIRHEELCLVISYSTCEEWTLGNSCGSTQTDAEAVAEEVERKSGELISTIAAPSSSEWNKCDTGTPPT